MPRLPKPGEDDGTWGDLLNEYLSVELSSDGSLKKADDIADAVSAANAAQQTANAAQTTAGNSIAKPTGLQKGDLVVYNGSAFVRLPGGNDGQMLVYDSSQATGIKWQDVEPGVTTLAELEDVDVTNMSAGQSLRFTSDSTWSNESLTLEELEDVDVTGAQDGDSLVRSEDEKWVPALIAQEAPSIPQVLNFEYTGAEQTWTVPAGVSSIKAELFGGMGSESNAATSGMYNIDSGGLGGKVKADMSVSEGDVLYIYVGGGGTMSAGGFNGGGSPYTTGAGGGGGATDIRIAGNQLSNRRLIAGGGGGEGGSGSGGSEFTGGGKGGGEIGGWNMSADQCGKGGTQTQGGNGHYSGSLGVGGNGYGAGNQGGGGGGGGYYGGGGGSNWPNSGGGGGGSSYANLSVCSNVEHTQGVRSNNGFATIIFNQAA